MNDRADALRQRIEHTVLVELKAHISSVPREQWHMDNGTARFGFQWPVLMEDSIVLPVCYEVMAEATEWMDDIALDQYLDLIEYQILRHVMHLTRHNLLDTDERVRVVDDELWDLRPEAMEWLNSVQMQMLDGD